MRYYSYYAQHYRTSTTQLCPAPESNKGSTINALTNTSANKTQTRSASGSAYASFGEIVQGRLSSGEDFLVTLPVDLWSRCQLRCTPISGRSIVSSRSITDAASLAPPGADDSSARQKTLSSGTKIRDAHSKARAVAEQLLILLNKQSGVSIELSFKRDMPVGKGLSSSTADMLAVVRAFQQAFAFELSQQEISALFAQVEPHDALHYPTSVAYNHRSGRLLNRLGYTPDFCIVGVDSGGELSTLAYNQHLSFSPAELCACDRLYADLLAAFAQQDDAAIACCASRSAELHSERTVNGLLISLLERADSLGGLGVIAAHSGTCAGVLLAGNSKAETVGAVAAELSGLGRVFMVKTLLPDNPITHHTLIH